MKKLKNFLLILLLAFTLTSCHTVDTPIDDEEPVEDYTYYSVEFDSQGGSYIESQQVLKNNPVIRPSNPILDNHSFVGWYKTALAEEDSIWNFDTDRVTSNIILYAAWLEDEVEEATPSLTYNRISTGYEVSGVGTDERIIIPETYQNEPVTAIGDSAFARKQITYVSIPDNVTSIGLNSFNNASTLKEVKIRTTSKLTTIGNNAFSGNSMLESIYLPATLESIGSSAFNNASSLNSIVVALENENYYSAGNNLIETSTQILIRGSNTSTIPNGVKIIGSAAFRRSSLTSIFIPSSVETIENYAFDDCKVLTEINVDENNSIYSSQDGVLYSKDKTRLITVPEGSDKIITIPDTIVEIPSFAFDRITTIKEIYIPTSVANIRSFAFREVAATIYYLGTEAMWNSVNKHSTWGGDFLDIIFKQEGSTDTVDIYTIYFSASGNTKGIAELIASYTNSSSYEIIAKIPYTSSDLNYSNSSSRATLEQYNPNARPEIGSSSIDLSEYEVIFLGYPIWWGMAPKIIYTFLETYNLDGKIIIPFCTSGGSAIGGSISDLKSLEPNATWLNGTTFKANASISIIGSWIDSLNY